MNAKDTVKLCPRTTGGWSINCDIKCHEAQALATWPIAYKEGYDKAKSESMELEVELRRYFEGKQVEAKRAAMKRVVEWVKETVPYAFKYFEDERGKVKLEEWGI